MLAIRLLGDLTVLRDGEPLALPPSKKTRALLAYLVATGRPQRRERLCRLLWEVPDDPRGALRWSLSKLRALVDEPNGAARLLADRDAVRFVADGVSCDLHALRALASDRSLNAAPLERLTTTADTVRGDFLEGLDLSAQSDFQAWCVAEREDARRQHAAVLRALVARLPPEEALTHARRLVGLDPFDAAPRAALVDLLASAGRREEAEQHLEAGLAALREAGLPADDLARAGRALRSGQRTEASRGSEEPRAVPRPSGPNDAASELRRLVIVDDEPELGAVVSEYLGLHGFAVRAAASGRALDNLLAESPADLVVLDVNLPGEDGFSIARRLRARGGPPVLFLTADSAVVDRVAGLELGAEDYVTKPFDLRELRARIGVALRRAQAASSAADSDRPVRPDMAQHARPEATPDGPQEPERKQVTVLVAALAEAAAQDGEVDAEAAMERLDEALAGIRAAVARHEGSVTAAGAAGLTAVFGAPVAHEDDAVSACLAALAACAAFGAAPSHHGAALRIGLHSGEVVVRAAASGLEAVGPAMRLAAAVAAAAAPGGIALSEETARRAEGFVETAPLRADPAAGPSPLRILALTGRAPPRSRWDVRAVRGLTPFLGRDAELAALARALDGTAAGRGAVVAIAGEPGIGKSRLVHEFLDTVVPPEWAALAVSALPGDAGGAYLPVARLLRAWLGVGERETREEVTARLHGRLGALPPLLPHRAALASLLDLSLGEDEATWRTGSPGLRRRATQAGIRAVLATETERRPLVVVMEDLHWADAETLGALDALIEGIGPTRLLLLATHRPEFRHGWAGRSGVTQLRLDPLRPAEAEALLQSLLGDDATFAELRRGLADRAGGVPLFLEEASRALTEAGTLSGQAARRELPATVQAVLAARIDRLPPRAKSLLQVASVLGREIPLAPLARVAGLPEEVLHDTLAELREAEFLFETRLLPEPDYAFKHAMTQEAAYASLLRDRRRALHAAIFRAIEEIHPERLDEQVDRLAHHALAGELWENAVHYLLRAANRAVERSAHAQAADLLQRGLDAMKHLKETPDRLRVELGYRKALGVTMMALKGWGSPEVADAYLRARGIAEQLHDERELFVALRGQGQFHMIRGELRTARTLGAHCMALAARSGDPGVGIETHHLFWSNSFFMGEYAEVEGHAHHGMQAYDAERDHHLTFLYSGHDPGVCCRCFSGLTLWQRGHADGALTRCREALVLAERLGHPLTLALAYWALGYVHLFRREPVETRSWAERGIAICEAYQMPLLVSQSAVQLGWAVVQLGELDAGIAQMRQGLAGVVATSAEMGLPYFAALLGEALAKAGRIEEGLVEVTRALAMAERNGARFQFPEMLRLKGELLRCGPKPDDAAADACFRQALDATRTQGARLPELRALTSLVRLRRHEHGAAAALALAYGWFTEGLDSADLSEARMVLGT